MTSAEAQRQFEKVNRNLDTTVECLVKTPWRVREVHQELGATAAALKSLYEQRGAIRSRASVIPALRKIQARVGQVQVLLDAAVTFYCGAISGTLAQSGAYRADGQVATAPHGGCLKFEA
jgi:hypothetical protein